MSSPNWIRNTNRSRRRNAAFHKERSNPVPFVIGVVIGLAILVISMLIF